MQYTLFDLDSPIFNKLYLFKNSTNLGSIYQTINWSSLIELLPKKKTMAGAPSWLPAQGYFGLMFLKHYTKLSDEKLLERFNTDWSMQMFCGVLLTDNEFIKDNSFVSKVRNYLSQHVDFEVFQSKMIKNWKEELPEKNVMLADATCYEVYIRFPTDAKILWECCEWLWNKKIPQFCRAHKLKEPRSKFQEQKKKHLVYCKLRKKTHRKTQARKRAYLHLLSKGINEFQSILNQTKAEGLSHKEASVFKTIKQVYQQQNHYFNHPKSKIKHRIVSLHKPYIRPIVRGKENKPVEFGIKVHKVQVGGINLIEHASYEAFNECKRLKISVLKHKNNFGECTHLSTDKIYATNENRRFCTQNDIQTNFVRKGAGKDDKPTKKIKELLNKQRSTSLEGSFGTEKEHYLLHKIKAQNPATERVWLFFGIHTANAVKIASRREKAQKGLRQAA
ncbi:transposase [Runella salmonicolor]|uniref:Transposase n=1 Tax=Runella salmonicolor TaxID=2950278 RepID=A0ABT1G0K9_9BACT|nr:transposase [Runella salmonicolor]MCP1386578.1 transposase [Runella salmonicolor]